MYVLQGKRLAKGTDGSRKKEHLVELELDQVGFATPREVINTHKQHGRVASQYGRCPDNQEADSYSSAQLTPQYWPSLTRSGLRDMCIRVISQHDQLG